MDRTNLSRIAVDMMSIALANLERDGHVAFVTMVVHKDGTMTPIMLSSTSSSNKQAFGAFLRRLSPDVDAIIIISEAWTLMPEDVDGTAFTMPVSQNPKRVEGVFVTAQSCYGELVLTKTFKRDKQNKPIVDGDILESWTSTPTESAGNFSSLFASKIE